MYSITIVAAIFFATLLGSSIASPVVRKSLNPNFPVARSPLTADAFAADATDWPTNVVFVGGSQTYGLWVPKDGSWYDLGNIECLGLPANAIGDCNDMTVNQIGVVAGSGPCQFVGVSASWVSQPTGGFLSHLAPPRRSRKADSRAVLWIQCYVARRGW
jgi:hypothetical protein